MRKVLIDTALLAVPNYAEVGSDADELIDRVAHFSQLALPDVPIDMLLLDGFEEALWGDAGGPDFEAVEAFLNLMNLSDIYSAQDLYQQYMYLLDATSRASSYCSALVSSHTSFSITPSLPKNLFPSSLRNETIRVLAQLCYQNHCVGSSVWMFGSSLCTTRDQNLRLSAIIEDVEVHDEGALPIPLPITAVSDVPTFHGVRDFISIDTATDLWAEATNAVDFNLAITVGAMAIRGLSGKPSEILDLNKFRIGSSFIESLKAHQCCGTSRFSITTGRICMEIVAECYAAHITEMGKPSQTQRQSDGALAYRLHITSSGIGLRLMFWQSNGVIEFANVGPKHELVIESGNSEASVTSDFTGIM